MFKKYLYKITIKSKLIIIITILILYPLLIIGYFGYKNYAEITIEKSINYSKKEASRISNLLSEKINRLNLFPQRLLYDNKIYDANMQLNANSSDYFSEYVFRHDFENYLKSILLSNDEFDSVIFYFSSNKKTYLSSRLYTMNIDILSEINNLHEYAKGGKGTTLWYVKSYKEDDPDIYLVKTVYDIYTYKEIGVLAFKINYTNLFNIFNDFSSWDKQNLVLYNNEDKKLFSINSFDTKNKKNININLNDTSKHINFNNNEIYTINNVIYPTDWKLDISISPDIVLKEIKDISENIIFLCLITIPIGLLLLQFSYFDIVKPLDLLIKKMHNIQNGNIGDTIKTIRSDEIGYLFKTFNHMSSQIENLINKVYKEQLAMKDAELKALQAQINPHFLYNTLEAINWKAKINGVDEISEMITALSSIIEANLNRNGDKFIAVIKEIEYINNYKFLIEKRFGKKIKFNINVEENVYKYIIPQLIIQPIVENAVYHGLETKKGGGTISISIKNINNFILIEVSDDGIGIEPHILENLKNNLENNTLNNDINDSSKIGIINVHRRITLLYGENYGLEIFSVSGDGTKINIKLPINELST